MFDIPRLTESYLHGCPWSQRAARLPSNHLTTTYYKQSLKHRKDVCFCFLFYFVSFVLICCPHQLLPTVLEFPFPDKPQPVIMTHAKIRFRPWISAVMLGLLRWPMLEVVCRGSWPRLAAGDGVWGWGCGLGDGDDEMMTESTMVMVSTMVMMTSIIVSRLTRFQALVPNTIWAWPSMSIWWLISPGAILANHCVFWILLFSFWHPNRSWLIAAFPFQPNMVLLGWSSQNDAQHASAVLLIFLAKLLSLLTLLPQWLGKPKLKSTIKKLD